METICLFQYLIVFESWIGADREFVLTKIRKIFSTSRWIRHIHVSDVKFHSRWFRQTHSPSASPLHNVCAGNGSGEIAVELRVSIPFTPFRNWEANAQISAWKRVIFAYTSNFHYRRTLSFLYLLTATGCFVIASRSFFSFFALDIRQFTGKWMMVEFSDSTLLQNLQTFTKFL